MKFLILFSLFLGFGISISACYKEHILFAAFPSETLELPLILDFNEKSCFFDERSNSFRYSIAEDSILNFSPFVQYQEHSTILINDIPLENNMVNNLGTIKTNETYTVSISTLGQINHFTLSFTTFPTVRIITRNQIKDNPKLLARLNMNYPADSMEPINTFVEIDYRGSSSQKNPKKSYGFSFLQERNIGDNLSKGIFNWKKNEDWILDAVYNDYSKFRNKVSFEIWEDMNPEKHNSIQSEFVEVFLNNSYEGLYCLNEQMNPEKLDLPSSGGFLYKTTTWSDATCFVALASSSPPSYTDFWDDWEQKHPYSNNQINWQPLYDLRNLVSNYSDQQFIDEVSTYLDIENLVDYYLFIHLVGAHDNHGKNMFWVKPTATAPFSIIPWDIDAAWGRDWDGQRLLPTIIDIQENYLFKRLLRLNPDNFKLRLKIKWQTLRANGWSDPAIKARLDQYFDLLLKSDVAQLENARWGTMVDLEQERFYIHNWLTSQYNMLDLHFNNL